MPSHSNFLLLGPAPQAGFSLDSLILFFLICYAMYSKLIIFLEILLLLCGMAWFTSQHKEHLMEIQKKLSVLQESIDSINRTQIR